MNADLTFWKGEPLRQLRTARPCDCGCDHRNSLHKGWAGYITASDADGNGFTLWIKSEITFDAMDRCVSVGVP